MEKSDKLYKRKVFCPEKNIVKDAIKFSLSLLYTKYTCKRCLFFLFFFKYKNTKYLKILLNERMVCSFSQIIIESCTDAASLELYSNIALSVSAREAGSFSSVSSSETTACVTRCMVGCVYTMAPLLVLSHMKLQTELKEPEK